MVSVSIIDCAQCAYQSRAERPGAGATAGTCETRAVAVAAAVATAAAPATGRTS